MTDERRRCGSPAAVVPDVAGRRSKGVPRRLIRSPSTAELALLRWLDTEPRPVAVGPIGQCVKRGWCRPAFKHIIDDGVQKTVAIYFVTSLGRHHLSTPDSSIGPDHDGRSTVRAAGSVTLDL